MLLDGGLSIARKVRMALSPGLTFWADMIRSVEWSTHLRLLSHCTVGSPFPGDSDGELLAEKTASSLA